MNTTELKRILALSFAALLLTGLYAQENEIQTIVGSSTRISGMGGPLMSFSSIDGEFAHMIGGGIHDFV